MGGSKAGPKEVLDALEAFHRTIDEEASRLARIHRERILCRKGCGDCCVDGITVFEVEALGIVLHHRELLAEGLSHPEGACAFLDTSGACRIYDHRPYVCRTHGLPLRWMEQDPGGSYVEMRDICPKNDAEGSIMEIDPAKCWTLGPAEDRLALLQAMISGGRSLRVPLRSIFGMGVTVSEGPGAEECLSRVLDLIEAACPSLSGMAKDLTGG
jgi:Fe-S-cluster containining protein